MKTLDCGENTLQSHRQNGGIPFLPANQPKIHRPNCPATNHVKMMPAAATALPKPPEISSLPNITAILSALSRPCFLKTVPAPNPLSPPVQIQIIRLESYQIVVNGQIVGSRETLIAARIYVEKEWA